MENLNVQNETGAPLTAGGMFCVPIEVGEDFSFEKFHRIPFDRIASFGASFTPMVSSFSSLSKSGNGIYMVVSPRGTHLGDSHSILGSVLGRKSPLAFDKNNKLAGQAQLIQMPFDAAQVCVGLALESVVLKLDKIIAIGTDILDFMEEKEKAESEANIASLNRISEEYKVRYDDSLFLSARAGTVSRILRDAVSKMNLRKKKIAKKSSKSGNIAEAIDCLGNYRESAFAFAYASYLDLVVSNNFKKPVIENKLAQLKETAAEYKKLYDETYSAVSKGLLSSPIRSVADGAAGILDFAGRTVGKIPIVSLGPVDEALIAAGKGIAWRNMREFEKHSERFSPLKESPVSVFSDNVKLIGRVYGESGTILADRDNLYVSVG